MRKFFDRLLLVLSVILVMICFTDAFQQASAEERYQYTGEECAALGAMTAKFAYYHELWYFNHDNEQLDMKTGMKFKDTVPDLSKGNVIATVNKWNREHPPFNEPKYSKATLYAVEVAYAPDPPEPNSYLSIGDAIKAECDSNKLAIR